MKKDQKGKHMRDTYMEELAELKISAREYDDIIHRIYDLSERELLALAKAIKSGAPVASAVKKAFERTLAMRYAELRSTYNYYFNSPSPKKIIIDRYALDVSVNTAKTLAEMAQIANIDCGYEAVKLQCVDNDTFQMLFLKTCEKLVFKRENDSNYFIAVLD